MRYGIIGNCAYSALLLDGSVEWMCWPRMDSSFVFGPMLDREKGGAFRVELIDAQHVEQEYIANTNVLRTEFRGPSGAFELIDFAPRFQLYGRSFKPTSVVRILRKLEGDPLVRVVCQPTYDYGRKDVASWMGSNHIQFVDLPAPVRLTTNIPLTYVQEGRPFVLSGKKHLVLTWGQPLESPLEETADSFLQRTIDYWRRWVKHTRVPREYQDEVIRSALVLKLHQYEDTGAIIAATTTSIPEFRGSGRNWDYRYCWLRDTYYSLHAFERLGHFDEMEGFLRYLKNLWHQWGEDGLQPVYAINGAADIEEEILEHLDGFEGEKPVRIGNQASEHVQNDVYGEMILAISRLLLDTRFAGSEDLDGARNIVMQLLTKVEENLDVPDAGLWELRNTTKLHSFTVLAHWAGASRAIEIASVLGDADMRDQAERIAKESRALLETRCWDDDRGVLTQAADHDNLDAAMLMATHFGFWDKGDPRAASHVEAIRSQLQVGKLMKRYDVPDDFGDQEAAFTVCSFWLVESLAHVGRQDEARDLFHYLLSQNNGLGLYSEDILPQTGEQSGNFPQTYSHVGVINAAFRLSRDWD